MWERHCCCKMNNDSDSNCQQLSLHTRYIRPYRWVLPECVGTHSPPCNASQSPRDEAPSPSPSPWPWAECRGQSPHRWRITTSPHLRVWPGAEYESPLSANALEGIPGMLPVEHWMGIRTALLRAVGPWAALAEPHLSLHPRCPRMVERWCQLTHLVHTWGGQ